MKIYLVQSEHPWVPGNPIRAFFDENKARKYAAELVEIIRVDFATSLIQDAARSWVLKLDLAGVPNATPENFNMVLKNLHEIFSNEDFDVEIGEMEVE